MTMNWKKTLSIAFGCVATLAVAVFFFWSTLPLIFVEHYLHRFCNSCLDGELQFERILQKEHAWVVLNPKVKTKHGHTLTANEIVITYDTHPFLGQFHLAGDLTIEEGHLFVHSRRQPAQEIVFQFKGELSGNSGQLTAQWPSSVSSALTMTLVPTDDLTVVDVNCVNVPGNTFVTFLKDVHPALSQWKAVSGAISGHFTYRELDEGSPIFTGTLTGSHLKLKHSGLMISAQVPELSLLMQPEGALFDIKQPAHVVLAENTPYAWHLDQISGSVDLRNGKSGMALNGKVHRGGSGVSVQLTSDSVLDHVQVQAKSTGANFAALVPPSLHAWVEKSFANNEITLTAHALQLDSGVHLEGGCEVTNFNAPDHSITFGFDLKPSSEHLAWAKLWHDDSDIEAGLLLQPVQILRKQMEHLGVVLENGWINGKHIPLDKLTEPFLFEHGQLTVKGTGNFNGTFDHRALELEYEVHDFAVDHPLFTFALEDAGLVQHATHAVDLSTGEYFGQIPLSNVTFLDKKNGLKFTNITAHAFVEPHKLQAFDVEAFCNEVYFAGGLQINYQRLPEGFAVVDVHAHTIDGYFSHVQQLLSNLYQTPFLLQCPLEGNVSLRQPGASLHLEISPEKSDVQAHLDASLSDGRLLCPNSELALRDLSFNFTYDHKENFMEVSDIQGALLVGSSGHAEEYVVAGDRIRFTDYENSRADFDLWVGDKNHDIVRLIGTTKGLEDHSYVEVSLDTSQSHFSNVHPDLFRLVLRDWSHVQAFQMGLTFQLGTLLHDLQSFSRTGGLFLPGHLLKELNSLKTAQGQFKIDLQYDDTTAQFSYLVNGKDVAVGKHTYQNLSLNGKKKDNTWSVDQLQLDDLSIAADISTVPQGYRLNFLGIRRGDSFVVGLEGKYQPEKDLLEGKVNLLEVDLERLHEWPALEPFVAHVHPKGKLNGSGHIQIHSAMQNGKIDAHLILALRGCELSGFRLQDADNVPAQCSNTEISIQQLHTSLLNPYGVAQALIHLENLNYNFASRYVGLSGLNFKIPVQSMPWVANHLQSRFPETFTPTMGDLITNLKKSGLVEGSLTIAKGDSHTNIELTLQPGKYLIRGNEYEVQSLSGRLNPAEWQMNAVTLYRQQPLCVSMRSQAPDFAAGEATISDPLANTLHVQWVDKNLTLQRVSGTFSGITADLSRPQNAAPESMELEGNITIDPAKAVGFVPNAMEKLFQEYRLGGQFQLSGKWNIARNDLPLWQERLSFEGSLIGNNNLCRGFQVDSIFARASIQPARIQLQGLKVQDQSGSISVPEASVVKGVTGNWTIQMPQLTVKQFQPHLLRCVDETPSFEEEGPLLRKIELRNFVGDLGNPLNFAGKGRAYYANPPKREKQHPIIRIPSEILTKLGLDLSALSPVSGAVDYKIEQGKIWLTKFKDMYSIGRLSRFYLSKKAGEESYIDFDGNVHMKVRMKQYNLLFKLAELFTITVEGTVRQPTYSIFKDDSNNSASAK